MFVAMAWYIDQNHEFPPSSVNKTWKPTFFTQLTHKIPDLIEGPAGVSPKLSCVIKLSTFLEVSKLD